MLFSDLRETKEIRIIWQNYLPKFHKKECDLSQEDKIRMVMSGIALGDMIGYPYEGRTVFSPSFSPDTVPLLQKDSQFSDDTVMSFAILQATKQFVGTNADKEQAAQIYTDVMRQYAKRYPDAGYGWHFYNWAVLDRNDEMYKSFGDGSAMRSGIIGAVCDDVKDVIKYSYYSALPTHSHPEGINGAVVTAVSVWMALHGAEKEDILQYACEHYKNGFRTYNDYYADGKQACMDPSISMEELKSLGILSLSVECQIAVPEAIANFYCSDSFESCIRNGLRYPSDTDTVGAISGGIAAAFYRDINLDGYHTEEELLQRLKELMPIIHV